MCTNDICRPSDSSRASGLTAKARNQSADRIPAGAKLLGCMALSVLALGAHTVAKLAVLTGVNLLLLFLFRCGYRTLWRGTKVFLQQAVIVTGLYLLRFGLDEGLVPGLKISCQLFLTFLPGAILVQTTPQARIVRTLARIMPWRPAFVMATCLRFIPLVLDEIRTIHEAQALRGAKILPSDLVRPWNWPDVIHCLVVPAIIRSLKLAGEIALAAKARDFGVTGRRTFWPGR